MRSLLGVEEECIDQYKGWISSGGFCCPQVRATVQLLRMKARKALGSSESDDGWTAAAPNQLADVFWDLLA